MNEHNLPQLKEYLKKVFELEGAIYQHQQLIDGYAAQRKSNMPAKPEMNIPSPPIRQAASSIATITPVNKTKVAGFAMLFYFAALFAALFIILPIVLGGAFQFMIWGFLCVPVAVFSWKKMIEDQKRQKDELALANTRADEAYTQALEAHRMKVANAEKEHALMMQSYIKQQTEYNQETYQQLKKFEEVKQTLQASLTRLYAQNVIYAKYRNLVAIATIHEYFESGRCFELEGPNGAYNMYEGELRSSIIISSLSEIITNLGQIKNGQYALYEQICRSQDNVAHMLKHIYNAQMLTAYYANAAAIAASADRIIYGVIH